MTKLQMAEALADDLSVEAQVLGLPRQKEIRNTELIIRDHEKQRQYKLANEVCKTSVIVRHWAILVAMLGPSELLSWGGRPPPPPPDC